MPPAGRRGCFCPSASHTPTRPDARATSHRIDEVRWVVKLATTRFHFCKWWRSHPCRDTIPFRAHLAGTHEADREPERDTYSCPASYRATCIGMHLHFCKTGGATRGVVRTILQPSSLMIGKSA